MPRIAYTKDRFSMAGNPLRTLSPKTIAALALMALMGGLWLRVLTAGKTGPAGAQAAALAAQVAASQKEKSLKIAPVALPVIEGRNDTLTQNFFSMDNWSAFGQPDKNTAVSKELSEQQQRKIVLERLSKTLNLDAILQATGGLPPRVCIDGKVLATGDTLTLRRDTQTYHLTVSQIDDSRVVLTWDQASVVLNMAQPESVE